MRKGLLLIVLIIISSTCFSQTKRIAHRSHSGSEATFSITAGFDNFGLPPPKDTILKSKQKPLTKKDSLRLKLLPKDSLKTKPVNTQADTIKHASAHKEVYEILSEVGSICSR